MEDHVWVIGRPDLVVSGVVLIGEEARRPVGEVLISELDAC